MIKYSLPIYKVLIQRVNAIKINAIVAMKNVKTNSLNGQYS